MSDKEVNITFETLFEILRTERNREELQSLPATFAEDLKSYIYEKKHMAQSMPAHKDQLENIRRMLRELYDLREQKIVNLAIMQSRSDKPIEAEALLAEEQPFFDSVLATLKKHRGEMFAVEPAANPVEPEPAPPVAEKPVVPVAERRLAEPAEPVAPVEPEPVQPAPPRTMKIKFKGSVPKFVDRDLKTYGPYAEGDTAELPEEIAHILLKKGRASHL